jgi:hypothetical protein
MIYLLFRVRDILFLPLRMEHCGWIQVAKDRDYRLVNILCQHFPADMNFTLLVHVMQTLLIAKNMNVVWNENT